MLTALDAALDASAEEEASTDAGDGGTAFVCFPPMRGDFDRCSKGAMAGGPALRECLARQALAPAHRPFFRLGSGASVPFSKTRWRCAPAPLETEVHVTVDTIAGLDVVVPSTCASRAMDLIGPNFYGAVYFRCATRARRDDEVLSGD
jgi:hypothetical protein